MKPGSAKPLSKGQQQLFKAMLKPVSQLNIWLYRISGGWLGGCLPGGAPILLLTTIGRKSGQPRTVPLLYLEDNGNLIVVASQGGMSTDPLWYKNLEATPGAEIQIGQQRRKVQARRATEDEKAVLWPKLTARYQSFDLYQARTARNIPVVILAPSA